MFDFQINSSKFVLFANIYVPFSPLSRGTIIFLILAYLNALPPITILLPSGNSTNGHTISVVRPLKFKYSKTDNFYEPILHLYPNVEAAGTKKLYISNVVYRREGSGNAPSHDSYSVIPSSVLF